jgi:sec-independent protein translocase protein TatA
VNLGPVEIGLIVLAVMLLFGYKKLPDASRSLGRSLRIFKSEVGEAPATTVEDRPARAAEPPIRPAPASPRG